MAFAGLLVALMGAVLSAYARMMATREWRYITRRVREQYLSENAGQ